MIVARVALALGLLLPLAATAQTASKVHRVGIVMTTTPIRDLAGPEPAHPAVEVRLRVIGRADLLHEKLRAAADPARRRSKRVQDLADAHALLESTPALASALTPPERAVLDRLPG